MPEPTELLARRVGKPINLSGRLDDPAWHTAERSPAFVDVATGEPALLETRCAVLWDDANLYVGFWIEEPYPNAKLTERDSLIFQENDVELFVDAGDAYYELEINALGSVYEVLFLWRDAYSRFDQEKFDVLRRHAVTFGGNFDRDERHFWKGTHPRGLRWAFLDWDLPGLQTAVHVDGTLNNTKRRSRGWTVEMALPWAGLGEFAAGKATPPTPGDVWRLFLGRFQKIRIGHEEVQAAWCLSPHGVYDTHMPERFTPVRFVE